MESITTLTVRRVTTVPVQPVRAVRPATREGAGRVSLLPDSFAPSVRPEPRVTYGRDGTGAPAG